MCTSGFNASKEKHIYVVYFEVNFTAFFSHHNHRFNHGAFDQRTYIVWCTSPACTHPPHDPLYTAVNANTQPRFSAILSEFHVVCSMQAMLTTWRTNYGRTRGASGPCWPPVISSTGVEYGGDGPSLRELSDKLACHLTPGASSIIVVVGTCTSAG